jgi:hypothetical protein
MIYATLGGINVMADQGEKGVAASPVIVVGCREGNETRAFMAILQTTTLRVSGLVLLLLLAGSQANAQFVSAGVSPPPTLAHELFLVLVGAVLGGFLGPLFQILDGWLGITPGVIPSLSDFHP